MLKKTRDCGEPNMKEITEEEALLDLNRSFLPENDDPGVCEMPNELELGKKDLKASK